MAQQQDDKSVVDAYSTIFNSQLQKIEGIIGDYIREAKSSYNGLDDSSKIAWLARQERFIEHDLENLLAHSGITGHPISEGGGFDYKRAIEIRKGMRLTQSKLTDIVGITVSGISRFETGEIIPMPHNPNHKKYLKWLADNGYDPYNIMGQSEKVDLTTL